MKTADNLNDIFMCAERKKGNENNQMEITALKYSTFKMQSLVPEGQAYLGLSHAENMQIIECYATHLGLWGRVGN